MHRGAVGLDEFAQLEALDTGKLGRYVCDFPSAAIHGQAKVIALPHLGASTREAEENCAIMVADQLRDYLEHGNIANAVNFPAVAMARESAYRVAIANANWAPGEVVAAGQGTSRIYDRTGARIATAASSRIDALLHHP